MWRINYNTSILSATKGRKTKKKKEKEKKELKQAAIKTKKKCACFLTLG